MSSGRTTVVIGATGKVGRHVVAGLLERGMTVQAVVRRPDAARLPREAGILPGDLSNPAGIDAQLDRVDAAFLLWPQFSDKGAADVVDMLARHAPRVVYLSAEAARQRPDSSWAAVERAIEASGMEWTFLRPTGFAANTLMWADQIRESGVVRWPYGQARRSLIHERDIADVAVHALTDDRHAGQRHVLTGPASLTQADQVQAIGDAIGRQLHWREMARDDADKELAGQVPDTALDTWASFVDTPEVVTETVHEVTNHPARPFADWAREHADAFR